MVMEWYKALPNGKTMLIDAGGAKFKSRLILESMLAPLLRKLGATKIDYVVISHPDQDHIGGLQYFSNVLRLKFGLISVF